MKIKIEKNMANTIRIDIPEPLSTPTKNVVKQMSNGNEIRILI